MIFPNAIVPQTAFVYALVGDGEIRYVGQTTNPEARWRTHRRLSDRKTRRWVCTVRELRMLILEPTNVYGRMSVEKRWMDRLRECGHDLINGVWHPDEIRSVRQPRNRFENQQLQACQEARALIDAAHPDAQAKAEEGGGANG